jgi:hypothetical protein
VAARTLTVDARRIERWATGFGDRHGGVLVQGVDTGLVLTAADGARAVLTAPFACVVSDTPALAAAVLAPRRVAAVLARRGGYACAVVGPDAVLGSKVGTRYVQGRTAAGGWSQHRFSRRRDNQTEDLVRHCADVAARVLDPASGAFDGLLTGGDRALVERVLADPRLRPLTDLPRLPHLPVGDPRAHVVKALPEHVRAVTVVLDEPG